MPWTEEPGGLQSMGARKELNISERLKLPLSVCEWTCGQVDSIVTDLFLLSLSSGVWRNTSSLGIDYI